MDRKLSSESSPGSSGFGEDEFSTTTGLRCSPMSSSVSSFELRNDLLVEDENGNREIVIGSTGNIAENRETSNRTQEVNGTTEDETGAWEIDNTGSWKLNTGPSKVDTESWKVGNAPSKINTEEIKPKTGTRTKEDKTLNSEPSKSDTESWELENAPCEVNTGAWAVKTQAIIPEMGTRTKEDKTLNTEPSKADTESWEVGNAPCEVSTGAGPVKTGPIKSEMGIRTKEDKTLNIEPSKTDTASWEVENAPSKVNTWEIKPTTGTRTKQDKTLNSEPSKSDTESWELENAPCEVNTGAWAVKSKAIIPEMGTRTKEDKTLNIEPSKADTESWEVGNAPCEVSTGAEPVKTGPIKSEMGIRTIEDKTLNIEPSKADTASWEVENAPCDTGTWAVKTGAKKPEMWTRSKEDKTIYTEPSKGDTESGGVRNAPCEDNTEAWPVKTGAKKPEKGTRSKEDKTIYTEPSKGDTESCGVENAPCEVNAGAWPVETGAIKPERGTRTTETGTREPENTSRESDLRTKPHEIRNRKSNFTPENKNINDKQLNGSRDGAHGTKEVENRNRMVENNPENIESITNGGINIFEGTSEGFSKINDVKPNKEVLNKTEHVVNKTINENNGTSNGFNSLQELSNGNLNAGLQLNNSTIQVVTRTQPIDPEEPSIADINKNFQNEQQTEPVKTVTIKIPEEEQEVHCNWSKALGEITKEDLQVEGTPVNGSINGGETDWDDDSESDADSDTGRTGKLKIPDGGWGWVVVFASLILSMIADGISFSFGLLYVELLREFGESKSKTAWIGSLFMAVPLLAGPVASALVDRYGCRKMTIAGGIISAIGFVASSQARSVAMMYATFGVLSGCGLGFCYVTAVVAVAYWFDKRRNLAVGLSACGTGIGTFLYAPLTQYFLDEYGWRGTTLLLAGTFLHMCICGCLMRDPEWWIAEQNRQSSSSIEGGKSNRNDKSSCGSVSGGDFPGLDEIKKLLDSGRGPEYILTTLAASLQGPKSEEEKANEHASSVVNIPTFINRNEKVPREVLESLGANKRLYNLIVDNYPSLLSSRSTSDTCLNKVKALEEVGTRVPLRMSLKVKRAKSPPQSPILSTTPPPPYLHELTHQYSSPEADASTLPLLNSPGAPVTKPRETSPTRRYVPMFTHPHTHYLKHIRVHRNSVMYRGAMLNTRKYRLRASSCPDIYTNSMTTLAKETEDKWYEDALDTLRGMADFSMLLEFHFLLLCLSTILLFTWFIVPYFYLAEHLNHHGYTELESSRLLSLIGVTNTIGMVGLGWAGDQPWMNVVKTYGYCLILCGISSAAIVWFTNNYILLSIACGSFGIFFASNYSFTPVILVQLMPLDKFTTAYGLVLLCQGIGNLLGPPLAGWLFDVTGHWDISFNQAGLWIVISGFLMLIIPYTNNKRFFGGELSLKQEDQDSIA